jgi:3-hydroxyisobutyrate dehydrogenase-like beta-hydroxyacid dehydrogenase
MKPKIGFIGLGLMGAGMARNFLTKGYPLSVYNRSAGPAEALGKDGARVAASPKALAAESDFIFTCVSDPAAVRGVALGQDGLLAGARRGARWVDTSTIGAEASRELAAAAQAAGVGYLEAPVTGSKTGAEKGTLVVMTGGERALHDECEPVIGAFAAKVIYVGGIGAGAVMKLIGNTILSFMLEGLAEGAVLGERAGVPLEKILEVVQASGFASPYWAFKGGAMQRRDFETHFSLDLMHKDQALALAEAAARKVPMPGLAAIHQMTSMARALGLGGEDIAAQLKVVEAAAGRKP